jgi:hypothetical protein
VIEASANWKERTEPVGGDLYGHLEPLVFFATHLGGLAPVDKIRPWLVGRSDGGMGFATRVLAADATRRI